MTTPFRHTTDDIAESTAQLVNDGWLPAVGRIETTEDTSEDESSFLTLHRWTCNCGQRGLWTGLSNVTAQLAAHLVGHS
jgi:hypothetical protein